MWPFKRKPPPAELVERIETLERGFRSLRLDWQETYDKIARMMGRIAKRAKLDETREDAPGSPQPGQPGTDPLSQAIIARRRRGLLPHNGG